MVANPMHRGVSVEMECISARNKDIGRRISQAQRKYSEYRKAFRKWSEAYRRDDFKNLKALEEQRDILARKAAKAYAAAGQAMTVLAWWWTFGE